MAANSGPFLDDLMEKPLCLIESQDGSLILNQSTVSLLQQVTNQVVVVGIAGTYRSGKSYLMNCLAGKQTGFELGSTVQSHTKGIWVWCRPHPEYSDTTLILMDTEGLEDVEKGDEDHDMKIIVLTLLLSSTFIFNTTGKIDNNLIRQLSFVSELTNHIQVKNGYEETGADFDVYFPNLVVAVRDFHLELTLGGNTVTANQYFEECLKLREKKGPIDKKTEYYNEPRMNIRKFFPASKRHCWVLPLPTNTFSQKILSRIGYLPKEEMNPEFLKKCDQFQTLIVSISQRKSFGTSAKANGRMFADMAECYVTDMAEGALPCIESALKLTALNENRRVFEECLQHYKTEIESVAMPAAPEVLDKTHQGLVSKIMNEFKSKIIFEAAEDLKHEFEARITASYRDAMALNDGICGSVCQESLNHLNQTIAKRIAEKVYMVPGGYDHYNEDLQRLKKEYLRKHGNLMKSSEVLQQFLQNKETEINSIVSIDKEMSVMRVKEEEAKRREEDLALRQKVMEEELEKAKQHEEQIKQTLQETAEMMQKEMQDRLNEQRVEFDRIIQERQAAYDQMSRELQEKIQQLQSQISQQRNSGGGGGGKCVIL